MLAFALVLTFSAALPAQEAHAGLASRLQKKLDEIRASAPIPGLTAGIALADGSLIALASGIVDDTTNEALRPDHRMLAGSIGKTFFAAVALQLLAEKKLDLDAKVEQYLGQNAWFARLPNAHDIRVRQLMNHTSGLVRYEFDPRFTAAITQDPDRVWSPQERLAFLFDAKAPFPAGERFEYSDTNYIVLGMIVEKVTGHELYAEVKRRVLDPLALIDTVPSNTRVIERLAQGHAGPKNPFGNSDKMIVGGKLVVNPQLEWAGGGFASTSRELARWARELWSGRVFSKELLPEVVDGVPAPMLGKDARYGLCVIVRDTRHGRSYGHSGFFPGWMSDMRWYPDLDLGVAIQLNTSEHEKFGRSTGAMLDDLVDIATGSESTTPSTVPKPR